MTTDVKRKTAERLVAAHDATIALIPMGDSDPLAVAISYVREWLAANPADYKPGDVFQVNEKYGRAGWVGAFVLAKEIKPWGIVGFVHHIDTHTRAGRVYIRLEYEVLDYIGHSALVLTDAIPTEATS